MANEIFKEIKTKIALKTLSYTEWDAIKETYKPLKGEVCICTIPEGNTEATNAPTVLFKVGDGVNFYKDLKWASALAADVHAWAKKSETDFITWVNTVVEHPAAPDLTPYLVKENITTGGANGTIAVRGEDVAVKGLGSAAYTDAGAYATAEQGGKADSAAATIATYGDIVTHNVSEFAPHDIDTGVHSVSLASGSSNGTVKLTVDGAENEVAITGLGSAAYVTVDSLNETAKGYADAVEAKLPTSADYGVLEVKGDEASGVVVDNTDAQRPIVKIAANTYDAHGAAAGVQGNLTAYENAHASDYDNAKIDELVQGAKDYAAGLEDANTEYHVEYDSTNKKIKLVAGADASKMEIDATDFIKDGMIDTVTIGEDNDLVITFNTAAGKDEIRLPLDQLVDIYTGVASDRVAVTVSSDKKISAELVAGSISKNYLDAAVQTSLGLADTALQSHQSLEHLATKEALEDVVDGTTPVAKATNADKLGGELPTYYATKASVDAIPGAIDDKIAAYNTSKNFGDIITHNVAEFASSTENGAKELAQGVKNVVDANKETWDKAGTALQASDLTAYDTSKNFGDIITHNAAEFATSEQGGKADTALQEITTTAGNGLKVTNKNNIDIDTDVVFVLDCNW